MSRITNKMLQRHFELAAEAMGWDYRGERWTIGPNENVAKVGHTCLEHNSVYGWNVNQICNVHGAERRLRESCTAAAMLAWLEGVCYAKWADERSQRAA